MTQNPQPRRLFPPVCLASEAPMPRFGIGKLGMPWIFALVGSI
jgi:hypothetical protein